MAAEEWIASILVFSFTQIIMNVLTSFTCEHKQYKIK